jgi:hypothetical protein
MHFLAGVTAGVAINLMTSAVTSPALSVPRLALAASPWALLSFSLWRLGAELDQIAEDVANVKLKAPTLTVTEIEELRRDALDFRTRKLRFWIALCILLAISGLAATWAAPRGQAKAIAISSAGWAHQLYSSVKRFHSP